MDGEESSGDDYHLYFLPLSAAWEDGDGDENLDAFRQHTLAKLRRRNRIGVLFDALSDESFSRAIVEAMGSGDEVPLGEGKVRFTRTEAFEELLGEEEISDLTVRRASVEQSNTSVIIGERLVLKAYRRLQKGTNPELEIGRFLTEETGFESTPPLAGAMEYEGPDGERITLSLLQGFVTNQGDGWSYVLNYLDRYFEERSVTTWSLDDSDGESGREELEASDAFFDELMRNLGLRTGELHAALAAPTNDDSFGSETASREEVEGWAETISDDVKRTFDLLKRRRKKLPEEAQESIELLLDSRKRLRKKIKNVVESGFEVVKSRHHGDYHLGQVLVVGNDFQIIDFEGEPARPLPERRMKHSPLRDVAGMLRSFDYAARTALGSLNAERIEELDGLTEWAEMWERRARGAFMEGYADGARDSLIYPEDEEDAKTLIELFTIEKALYEIRYELDNRPEWVGIPVRGVLDLLGDSEDES